MTYSHQIEQPNVEYSPKWYSPRKLYKHLKKPAIYTGLILVGAAACGFIGHEISDVVFNSVNSIPDSAPSLVKIAEATSQAAQNTYSTLGGGVAGGVGGGILARKITK